MPHPLMAHASGKHFKLSLCSFLCCVYRVFTFGVSSMSVQVALLLSTVQNDAPVAFSSVDLFPKGSVSQIARALTPADLQRGVRQQLQNLYSDGSGFSLFSRTTSFAKALELLVQLVGEAGAYIAERDPAFALPYATEPGAKVICARVCAGDARWCRWVSICRISCGNAVVFALPSSSSSPSSFSKKHQPLQMPVPFSIAGFFTCPKGIPPPHPHPYFASLPMYACARSRACRWCSARRRTNFGPGR